MSTSFTKNKSVLTMSSRLMKRSSTKIAHGYTPSHLFCTMQRFHNPHSPITPPIYPSTDTLKVYKSFKLDHNHIMHDINQSMLSMDHYNVDLPISNDLPLFESDYHWLKAVYICLVQPTIIVMCIGGFELWLNRS
eukprot:109386_1